MPLFFQFFADLSVVVDLAVEGDRGVAIVSDDGLVAAAQVDDFQAHRAQGGGVAFKDSLLVGTAVVQQLGQPSGNARIGGRAKSRKPRYATHLPYPRMGPIYHTMC